MHQCKAMYLCQENLSTKLIKTTSPST